MPVVERNLCLLNFNPYLWYMFRNTLLKFIIERERIRMGIKKL